MNRKELWNWFWEHKISASKPLDRYFVWVKKSDFETVKKFFRTEPYNLFHSTGSYRTKEFFMHIHAIEEGGVVCIHHDFGNWTRFWPLIIVHFFSDVLFYLIYCYFKGVKVQNLTKPEI
jgi:hypothetical protein